MLQEFTQLQLVTKAFAHNYLSDLRSLHLDRHPDLNGRSSKLVAPTFVVVIEVVDPGRSVAFDLRSKNGKWKLLEPIDFDLVSIDQKYKNFLVTLSSEEYADLVKHVFMPKFRQHFDVFLASHVSNAPNVDPRAFDRDVGHVGARSMNDNRPQTLGPTRRTKPIPASLAPPGFEDELEIRGGRSPNGPGVPPPYGDADRFPGGMRAPDLEPSPGARGPGTGGMYPSSEDPLFHPERRNIAERRDFPHPGDHGIRYDDPLAGPHDDLDLAGEGLPSDMGIGKDRRNPRGNFDSFGEGGPGFSRGFNGGPRNGSGGGFGGGFI